MQLCRVIVVCLSRIGVKLKLFETIKVFKEGAPKDLPIHLIKEKKQVIVGSEGGVITVWNNELVHLYPTGAFRT